MRRILFHLALVLLFVGVYVGLFSWYWLNSPATIQTWNGKAFRVVALHPHSFYSRTGVIWAPAMFFMKYGRSYQFVGQAAMMEDTIGYWAKEIPLKNE